MARRVFFSFHYDNDINRSMTVRNSWVTQGKEVAGFIDKAAFAFPKFVAYLGIMAKDTGDAKPSKIEIATTKIYIPKAGTN